MSLVDGGAGVGDRRVALGENEASSAAVRATLAEIQRLRLLSAMIEVASEVGFAEATVARVVAGAGVSRRTFYETFEDREHCFFEAFDGALARVFDYVREAQDPSAKWSQRIRTALGALLSLFDAERDVARVLVIASLGCGARVLERRQRALGQAIAAIDEGRAEVKAGSGLSPLTAEGVVGGVLSVIYSRLLVDDHRPLVELAGPLAAMVVLPYLGSAASRLELDRPAARAVVAIEDEGSDLLREAGVRLTYRTVRVLGTVAAAPGASNRMVASSSGIVDQGQISKLLARLERHGLIQNQSVGNARGVANAWMLTERGVRMERTLNRKRTRLGA